MITTTTTITTMTSAINIDDIHVDDSADDNIDYVDHVDVNDETMTMTMKITMNLRSQQWEFPKTTFVRSFRPDGMHA